MNHALPTLLSLGFALPGLLIVLITLKRVRDLGRQVRAAAADAEARSGAPSVRADLTPVELGALVGGVPRALRVAFASLVTVGLVRLEAGTGRVLQDERDRPDGEREARTGPLQAEMLRLASGAFRASGWSELFGARVQHTVSVRALLTRLTRGRAVERLLEDLIGKGLVHDPRPVVQARRGLREGRKGFLIGVVMFGWAVLLSLFLSRMPGISSVPLLLHAAVGLFVLVASVVGLWQIRAALRVRVPFLTPLGAGEVEQARVRYSPETGHRYADEVRSRYPEGVGAQDTDLLLRMVAVHGTRAVHGVAVAHGWTAESVESGFEFECRFVAGVKVLVEHDGDGSDGAGADADGGGGGFDGDGESGGSAGGDGGFGGDGGGGFGGFGGSGGGDGGGDGGGGSGGGGSGGGGP